jgi:hypothetical protein
MEVTRRKEILKVALYFSKKRVSEILPVSGIVNIIGEYLLF